MDLIITDSILNLYHHNFLPKLDQQSGWKSRYLAFVREANSGTPGQFAVSSLPLGGDRKLDAVSAIYRERVRRAGAKKKRMPTISDLPALILGERGTGNYVLPNAVLSIRNRTEHTDGQQIPVGVATSMLLLCIELLSCRSGEFSS